MIYRWLVPALEAENLKLRAEKILVETEVDSLSQENQILKEKLKAREIPVAGFDSTEPEPADLGERKQYCADISVFYDNILGIKLKMGVAEVRELIARMNRLPMAENMSRSEYDFFLRGTESAYWNIHDWCIQRKAELENYKQ
jgi:hypothetical protein